MKERKMVSIPAETHSAMSSFLEKQLKETGFKITASSFMENAILNAIKQGLYPTSPKRWSIDNIGTNP